MKKSELLLTSLIAIALLNLPTGCSRSQAPDTSSTDSSAQQQADDHGHPHGGHEAGPHDGTLADWGGGKYHVEFTVDHDRQEATVYILGNDEKTPAPINAEEIQLSISQPVIQVALVAAPLESDPAGSASRFVGNHEGLGGVQEFAGTITGLVDGTPYSGDFTEEPHGAHAGQGHSHGEEDALVWHGEPRSHAGLEIMLGHHGKHLHAGQQVEPAVAITRDGQPVRDAKVFNSLVSADGATVLAEEVATIFEPTTADEPAHYAQGALTIPSGVDQALIRFRIAPAEGDATTFEIPIMVE